MNRPAWFIFLAVFAAALLGTSEPGHADDAGLSWGTCLGPKDHTIDCTRNTGVDELVVQLTPPVWGTNITGMDFIVGFRFCDSQTVPPWWQFKNAGSCRINALAILPTTADGDCPGLWPSTALATWTYSTFFPGNQYLRIAIDIPVGDAISPDPGTSYDALHVRISHPLTTGAGACPGCSQPVWIYLIAPRVRRDGELNGSTMNVPVGYVTASANAGNCSYPVAGRRSTWGLIKSQYR